MKRREREIMQAACGYNSPKVTTVSEEKTFIAGAEWVEKACEYAGAKYDLDYCENVRDVLNYLKSLVKE